MIDVIKGLAYAKACGLGRLFNKGATSLSDADLPAS